jgi:WD40 repeat protein
MTDISGEVLKGYELKEQIGAGAFGAVYRAVQPQVGREVAIKVILPEHANRPDFIRRFEAEAHLVAQLEHLHIVPLYDYWREPDGAYLVMRLMQGGSLEDALHEKPLDLSEVSRIMDQIGAALAAAHHKGVVHRDLKPANILLDQEGNAYLSDFGIAKDLGVSDGLTGTGSILGSPAYLSPEQVQSEPLSPQTDIYSLGVVLFELLVGQHPFPDTPVGALLLKQVNQPLPSVKEQRPELPDALDAVVQRATAKDPAERHIDLNEFALELSKALGVETVDHFLTAEEAAALANPYKGLRAFQEADAADFFGREALTGQLLARLLEPGNARHFLAVVGPSGSGKSSVVQAGLIPALRKGALPGSQDWFIVEMVPGAHPLEELALGLDRISVNPRAGISDLLQKDENGILLAARLSLSSDEDKLLLVIDQFEELFTLVEDPSSVDFFLDSLHTAVCDPNSPLRVILTLRADFYDRPLMHAHFSKLVKAKTEVVVPLSAEELSSAVQHPAERVGAALEDGLATTIVADILEQPGALPLLQYALTELFERREGRMLTAEAYGEIGGVLGALGRRAEEIYARLGSPEQENARHLFLRLVTLGEGVEDTRRRVLQSELEGIQTSDVQVSLVLEAFGNSRLLTFDHDPVTRGPTVEVAHEALLREWPRLREWLDESRADLRTQRLLGRAAGEWQASRQDASFMLRGTRLERFSSWVEETDIALTGAERAFLAASLKSKRARDAQEAERQAREQALEKRSRTILRALVGFFALAAVVAVILTAFAFNQQGIAQENAAVAQSESDARATQQAIAEQEAREALEAYSLSLSGHASNALENRDTATALLLAQVAAQIENPPAETLRVLRNAAYAPGPRQLLLVAEEFPGVEGRIYSLAASPANDTFLIGFEDGNLILWDLASQSEIRRLEGHTDFVYDLAFSSDGKTALSGSGDHQVILWDLETGREIHRLVGHRGWVRAVAFSPNGHTAVSGGFADDSINSNIEPGDLFFWDLETGELIHSFESELGQPGGVIDLVFSPNGEIVLASYGLFTDLFIGSSQILWDVETGEPFLKMAESNHDNFSLAITSDGGRALSGGSDTHIHLWDLKTGEELQTFEGHGGLISSVVLSPDGSKAFSADWIGGVILWDLGTGKPLVNVKAHQVSVPWSTLNDPPVNSVFSRNGRKGLTSAGDGTLVIWDLVGAGEIRRFDGHDADVSGVQFTPDGKFALTGSGDISFAGPVADNSMKMWEVETGNLVRTFGGHSHTVIVLTVSDDGQWALTGSWDGTMKLWELETGSELRSFDAHPSGVFSVAFSPDGQKALSGPLGIDDSIILWDLRTGEIIHRFPPVGANATTIQFDANSRKAYAGLTDLLLLDLETGEFTGEFATQNCCTGFAIHPDGNSAFVVSGGSKITHWNLETNELIREFGNHQGSRTRLDITSDGQYLVSGAWDGTIYLWDLETGKEIRRFQSDVFPWLMDIDISSDGRHVISAGANGTAILWDLTLPIEAEEVRRWIAENRHVREPTCSERETFSILPLCGEGGPTSVDPTETAAFLLKSLSWSGLLSLSAVVASPLALIYFKRHK